MSEEYVYIISQKDSDGNFNKIVKSQERWWLTYKEAEDWFNTQEDWFKPFNAIFEVKMTFTNIKKIKDGKEGLERLYDLVKEHGLKGLTMYEGEKK